MSYTSLLTEDLTVWIPTGVDGYSKVQYDIPTYEKCRYQDSVERLIDDMGTEFTSTAVIYTQSRIPKHSFVYRGISTEMDPLFQENAFQIRIMQRSQNPTNSIVVYKSVV